MALFTTAFGLYDGVLWSGEFQGFIIHDTRIGAYWQLLGPAGEAMQRGALCSCSCSEDAPRSNSNKHKQQSKTGSPAGSPSFLRGGGRGSVCGLRPGHRPAFQLL
jgi:hypothetical protein